MPWLNSLIAPLSDIPIYYIKYPTMHKVQMHAGARRQLLYGYAYVWEIIKSLKLMGYLPVHFHKPYDNLHLLQNENYKKHFLLNSFYSHKEIWTNSTKMLLKVIKNLEFTFWAIKTANDVNFLQPMLILYLSG